MKKINPEELNLLVHTQPHRSFETDWSDEAIELLIKQRVKRCKNQLNFVMEDDRAFFCNHLNSQYIIYIKNGHEFGHFSIPTYNMMIDYLENPVHNRSIIQQALRQHFKNLHSDFINRGMVVACLQKYNKTEQDLENVLTEMILVL